MLFKVLYGRWFNDNHCVLIYLVALPKQIRLCIHVICGINFWLELGTNLHVIVEDNYCNEHIKTYVKDKYTCNIWDFFWISFITCKKHVCD
jgi:hypothetical protein